MFTEPVIVHNNGLGSIWQITVKIVISRAALKSEPKEVLTRHKALEERQETLHQNCSCRQHVFSLLCTKAADNAYVQFQMCIA